MKYVFTFSDKLLQSAQFTVIKVWLVGELCSQDKTANIKNDLYQ